MLPAELSWRKRLPAIWYHVFLWFVPWVLLNWYLLKRNIRVKKRLKAFWKCIQKQCTVNIYYSANFSFMLRFPSRYELNTYMHTGRPAVLHWHFKMLAIVALAIAITFIAFGIGIAESILMTHCLSLGMMPALLKGPYLQVVKVIFIDSYKDRGISSQSRKSMDAWCINVRFVLERYLWHAWQLHQAKSCTSDPDFLKLEHKYNNRIVIKELLSLNGGWVEWNTNTRFKLQCRYKKT